jgi:hypothetical protein
MNLDIAVVSAWEDFGRGADEDDDALSQKIKWLGSNVGKKTNFFSLLQYLITDAPEQARAFKGKIAEITAAIRANEQESLQAIVDDQYDRLINALVTSGVSIPDEPVTLQPAADNVVKIEDKNSSTPTVWSAHLSLKPEKVLVKLTKTSKRHDLSQSAEFDLQEDEDEKGD